MTVAVVLLIIVIALLVMCEFESVSALHEMQKNTSMEKVEVDEKDRTIADLKAKLSRLTTDHEQTAVALGRASVALCNIWLQNDNDPYFKVWAKKIAQDGLQRATDTNSYPRTALGTRTD